MCHYFASLEDGARRAEEVRDLLPVEVRNFVSVLGMVELHNEKARYLRRLRRAAALAESQRVRN